MLNGTALHLSVLLPVHRIFLLSILFLFCFAQSSAQDTDKLKVNKGLSDEVFK
jgi:hypothetical protein